MNKRRVVVTGIGMISPLGVGNEATWQGLVEGRSGIGLITKFDASAYPCRIAGEVRGFNPEDWIEKKEVKKSDTFIHYAVAAAQMAVDDAGLDMSQGRLRIASASSSAPASAGCRSSRRCTRSCIERGPSRISPFFIPGLIVNLAGGPCLDPLRRQGPELRAGHRLRHRRARHRRRHARSSSDDDADVMFAGGTEAVITPLAVGGFSAMRALSTRNDEPERASRPWDKDRDGFVMGEGAGIADPRRARARPRPRRARSTARSPATA